MHVRQVPAKNGRINVAIVQSYWQDGHSKTRTVKGFGYLDELDRIHGDGLGYVKSECDKMNAQAAKANASQDIIIYPLEKIDKRVTSVKNIGCAVPLFHYNSLGIEKVLRNKTRNSKIAFDINAVCRLLAIDRIISPGSKLSAWQEREGYFFKSNFTDDDLYRALSIIASAKSSVIRAMNSNIQAAYGRELSNVFYDVTNYHFEIDEEDDFRKRGICKKKSGKPIVAMGLVQDARGIPYTYRLFEGNTLDCQTLIPAMAEVKEELGLQRIVVVADRGINSSDNIAAMVATSNGFIFSQSIRHTKSTAELRAWALSEAGYKNSLDKDGNVTFMIKSRQDVKTITVEGELNPKTGRPKKKKVEIDTKSVAFWSAKYAYRDKTSREKTLAKSRELVKNPGAYNRATSYGAAKYVKNIAFDRDTGEIIEEAGKKAVIDEELIAIEEACDGYYCIITSETAMADSDIVDTYRELWRIEESFKVIKSCLDGRPVYVRTEDHIEAHFLICYIALVIMRLIQYTTGFAYSAETIIKELKKMDGVHLQDNWWRFSYRSDITEVLTGSVGIDLTRKNMRLEEIKGILTKVNGKQHLRYVKHSTL